MNIVTEVTANQSKFHQLQKSSASSSSSSLAQTGTPVARTRSRCGLAVLHMAVDLPHRYVSRPSVCSQVLVILRVLKEVFHRRNVM